MAIKTTLAIFLSYNELKPVQVFKKNLVEQQIIVITKMAVQKSSSPSLASIISVLSIVFYCVGFIRVELELNEQKNRINALESVAEAKPPSADAGIKIFEDASGKFVLQARNLH